LAFLASFGGLTVISGIVQLIAVPITMLVPLAWLDIPILLAAAFYTIPWFLTNVVTFGLIGMSAIRKFRSGIMLPRNILLSSIGIALLAFAIISIAYLMAFLVSAFTMAVPSLIIHVATLEFIVAMIVTLLVALIILSFIGIGFLISTAVLAIGLGIIGLLMLGVMGAFVLATMILIAGLIVATILGFIATLFPPLIPIIPIILCFVLSMFMMIILRFIWAALEIALFGGAFSSGAF
jgi:hypothetical protein